ncbi:MAG: GNAT family N-acetyltransferase [Chloroflexota bacterium]
MLNGRQLLMTYIGDFVTRSGQEVKLRLVKKGDAALLVDMFYRLSPETKRLRFHLYTVKIPEERVWQEAEKLSDLDPQLQVAIVATFVEADGLEHAVGVARFMRPTVEDYEAEVAVVVRDDFQRKGLGKHLLLTLRDRARALGITHFTAWVMGDNIRLMKLIKNMELKNVESETRYGQRKIRVPL